MIVMDFVYASTYERKMNRAFMSCRSVVVAQVRLGGGRDYIIFCWYSREASADTIAVWRIKWK